MALIKPITLKNGITVTYHRITSVNNITNRESIIEVSSYTSKEKREEEKLAIKNNQPMDVFIHTEYFNIPYDKTLDVEKAYEYIKTLENYQYSEDD